MPLAIPGRTKDAVVMVPGDSDWRPGVEAFLRDLGGDDTRIGRHLDLLEQRSAGLLPWVSQLAIVVERARDPGRGWRRPASLVQWGYAAYDRASDRWTSLRQSRRRGHDEA